MAHHPLERQRLVHAEHAHVRFGLLPARGLQAYFGDIEDPVQQRLVQADVVDPRERDLALRALQQAAADGDGVAADPVAVGEVLQHRSGTSAPTPTSGAHSA